MTFCSLRTGLDILLYLKEPYENGSIGIFGSVRRGFFTADAQTGAAKILPHSLFSSVDKYY
jgi:hypothetical protein